MRNFICAAEASGDLFAAQPIARRDPAVKYRHAPELALELTPGLTPELKIARMLCRRLRDKPARPDKRRIAHLIYLNLQSMLRHSPQRTWR